MIEAVAIAAIAALLIREHIALTERREWAKERALLLTRIQAPAQAMTITPLPTDPHDEQIKQWLSEEDEEREWNEANK